MSASLEKRLAVVRPSAPGDPLLEALRELPELVLDAVVEPRRQDVEPFVEAGVRVFRTLPDLLRHGRLPDVALVCTPPGDRIEVGVPLLCVGVDLLVRAPLATTVADAERLVEVALRADREVMTDSPLSLSPALLEAARVVHDGRIGALRAVEVSLVRKIDARAGWHGDPELSGGGVWAEIGPHGLDAVALLAGPVQRIRMLRSDALQGAGVEDEVCIETDHGEGRIGRIRGSWNEETPAPVARCMGDAGEILVGRSQSVLRSASGEEVLGGGYDALSACGAVLAEFLRRRCSRRPSADPGAAAVRWIHAAYRSVRDRRWQEASAR